MYQAIPEDFSQILLKRLFIFFCMILLAVTAIRFYQTIHPSAASYSADGNRIEMNKTDIVFSSLSL